MRIIRVEMQRREALCQSVVLKRFGVVSMNLSGKLIEQNDQCQVSLWGARPRCEVARGFNVSQCISKTIPDVGVVFSAVDEPFAHVGGRLEPKVKDVGGGGHVGVCVRCVRCVRCLICGKDIFGSPVVF